MLETCHAQQGWQQLWQVYNLDPKRSAIAMSQWVTPQESHDALKGQAPGKSLNTSRAAKSQPFSMTSWRKAAHVSALCPLSGNPKVQPFKKKQPNYNANSWGELWVQTTLNSDIQIFNSHRLHRCSAESPGSRLNWWFISSSWLVSSAPCRPDLPPSLRSPEVGASTWSHASPVLQNEKHKKNIQKFNFFRIIFKLTILDWSIQLTSQRVSNTTSKKNPVHFGLVKKPFVELDGPRQRR